VADTRHIRLRLREAAATVAAGKALVERGYGQMDDAIVEARAAGYTWEMIGMVVGVPRQLLWRKYGRR
jgi:hypothetical protein